MNPLPALLSAALLAQGAGQAPRPPIQLVEQASQEGFPLDRPFLDGAEPGARASKLQAVGVYLRIRDGQRLYALCLYADIRRLADLTRGKDRSPEALAAVLAEGRVAHAYISRFVQPVPRDNRMRFLTEHLKAYWPGEGWDPGSPAMKRFLAFFDRPVARGTETQVWIGADGRIATREQGGEAVWTRDEKLCRAFSASYLGRSPMDPAMKADLLEELPEVIEMGDLLSQTVEPGGK